jgi:hypothetical protein
MNSRKMSSVALATAAAMMFSMAAVTTASADEAKVHCDGVNSCKGHSACKNANNSCKGLNSCKGKGGCSTGDAGCKGKNTCKGKGGCATDSSATKKK